MAVVSKNSLSRKVNEAYRGAGVIHVENVPGLFRSIDVAGCPRRAAMASKEGKAVEVAESPAIRYRFHSLDYISVLRENVRLSDSESRLCGFVDMLVSCGGEDILVKIWPGDCESESPLKIHVYDMVTCMYLSGIWTGLLLYHRNGDVKCHFINPDRKACRKIIGTVAERSKYLASSIVTGTVPSGEVDEDCPSCPFWESCDEYRGSELYSRERREE